jgi:hypothetical protein
MLVMEAYIGIIGPKYENLFFKSVYMRVELKPYYLNEYMLLKIGARSGTIDSVACYLSSPLKGTSLGRYLARCNYRNLSAHYWRWIEI